MSQEAWVGVDLDGTLATYDGWQGIEHIGRPVVAIVELVRYLVAHDVCVKIFTARCQEGFEACEYIRQWTKAVFGYELEITDRKDFGLIRIIDDRATGVEMNTGKLLSELPDLVSIANYHWSTDNPNSPTYIAKPTYNYSNEEL